MCGMILDPVDTSRLGVANVGDVVNMAFDRISEKFHHRKHSLYPPRTLASATMTV